MGQPKAIKAAESTGETQESHQEEENQFGSHGGLKSALTKRPRISILQSLKTLPGCVYLVALRVSAGKRHCRTFIPPLTRRATKSRSCFNLIRCNRVISGW